MSACHLIRWFMSLVFLVCEPAPQIVHVTNLTDKLTGKDVIICVCVFVCVCVCVVVQD